MFISYIVRNLVNVVKTDMVRTVRKAKNCNKFIIKPGLKSRRSFKQIEVNKRHLNLINEKFKKSKKKKTDKLLIKNIREQMYNINTKTKFFTGRQERKEVYLNYANEQAIRTGLLLTELQGFIHPDEKRLTAEYHQTDLSLNLDIQAASKLFTLNLDFGPYNLRYSKNGRHLLLGGHKGHVAVIDWITKTLLCEMNVKEEIADVSFLHTYAMYACAQRNYVFIYDKDGTELHCIKKLYKVNRMEFLPHHFLLATGNKVGNASWLDVSIGELVGNFNTRLGEIRVMRQNPANGVLCIGDGRGVISMWSPKNKQSLANILCHRSPISALCVDIKGQYLITAGLDHFVKIWDIRSLSSPLSQYKQPLPINQVDFSQKGVLAISHGNFCLIYNNMCVEQSCYLKHHCGAIVNCMRFCPYEDILGIATNDGVQSIFVPGSGEPNIDALEDNPFELQSQRREREVHALLEKIPPEFISRNINEIASVDTLQRKINKF